MPKFRRLAPIALALLAASCAGPSRLARQSSQALAEGDLHKAYDRALRAVEKDPMNADARAAYTAASGRVAEDYRGRVRALAAADTMEAADLTLQFQDFRLEVARHGSPLPADPAYDAFEHRVRTVAGRSAFNAGRAAMLVHHPKEAWRDFDTCRRYAPDYPDLERQLGQAYSRALATVAVLPFADGIHVAGLSQDVSATMADQLAQRAPNAFQFTKLVDFGAIQNRITVADAENGPRDPAGIARALGADRVVTGRFDGMRSTTDLQYLQLPIYRRIEGKDDQGNAVVRWEESTLRLLTRQRDVTVQYDYDVVDARTGAVIAHHAEPVQASARVVWTDFIPRGDCDTYTLVPPDMQRDDPDRARHQQQQWSERMGSWTLPALLQRSRDDRLRLRWSTRYRGDFYGDTRQRPVWLAELPGDDDMAFVALHDAWRSVFATLKDLDQQD